MNKFRIIFTGRKIGAIGKTYPMSVEVEAKTSEEARSKLYDKFEHIFITVINKVQGAK